jgi:omega-6 fatty acid desaturase (delta-12 desaturase)
VAMVGLLSIYINRWGFSHFATRYLMPYLVVNFWLIFYTFMQHTDKRIPHYDNSEWNFVRGALATIDRPYHMFDFFHHDIGTSHVCHHFFSRIPHYHAAEATVAFKKVLGDYYLSDSKNVFAAFWEQYTFCKYVDADQGAEKGVLWFHRSEREQLSSEKKK